MSEEVGPVVFCDCKVWTGDRSAPETDAVAVEGLVVSALGPAALDKPKDWRRIRLEGRTVLPGLIDSHIHLLSLAANRLKLRLDDARSLEQAVAAVRTWAEGRPDDEWIAGRGWDHHVWADPVLPTRHDLDRVVGDRPVYLTRKDGHSAWVNSAALARVRVPDDASAELLPRDEHGAPLGIVREELMGRFSGQVPQPDEERLMAALIEEQEHLLSLGVIGVHVMEGSETLEMLNRMAADGQLQLKAYVAPGAGTPEEDLRERWEGMPVRPQGLKIFVDGSLGSGTAWMLEPDSSGSQGVAVTWGDELRAQVEMALRLGLDPCVHAIGDRAIRETLDAFEPFMAEHPERCFRIEHAQFIDPADMARVKAPNLALSVQPCHVLEDQHIVERLSPIPRSLAYAYGSMVAVGATLLMGTDAPVEPVDPWRNIAAAMHRAEQAGSPWHPEDKLDWEAILEAYCVAPARVAARTRARAGRPAGTLAPGSDANLIVVERDPGAGPPWEQKVALTVIEGRAVFSDASIRA
jgi:predicted amidohydrolase YtcJ